MTRTIAVAVAAVVAVLGMGGLLTTLGPWYDELRKPSWQPPDWLFGPAWTLIGALTACSAILAWNAAASSGVEPRVGGLFAVNGALNILWSGLFFSLRRPDWALAEVVPLWASIVALIVGLASLSAAASWLLAPYLAWVSFAAALNLAIVRLNAPFAST